MHPNANVAFLQICATRYYGALTGNLPTIHLKKVSPTEFSTVLFFHLAATKMLATQHFQPLSTLAPDSACQTLRRAGRVLLVQGQEGSATGDACLEEGAVCSPPAPGLPTERILAPHVLSSPWSKLRRGTAGRSAAI